MIEQVANSWHQCHDTLATSLIASYRHVCKLTGHTTVHTTTNCVSNTDVCVSELADWSCRMSVSMRH